MSEMLDVYDANLKHEGTMERLAAHVNGRWHQTFHLWLVDEPTRSVIYQVRSPQMVNFPSALDVTAAGHLEAGEAVEQGVREAQEELGLTFSYDSLKSLGYRVEVADQPNGQRNREYQAVFLAKSPTPLTSFLPDSTEVYGLLGIRIEDGFSLFTGSTETVASVGIAFDEATATWKPTSRIVDLSNFLPRLQQYYLTVHIMAERLLEDRFPLAIS